MKVVAFGRWAWKEALSRCKVIASQEGDMRIGISFARENTHAYFDVLHAFQLRERFVSRGKV